jgi:transcriptional regulator with XRE-family HTH domain
MKNNNKLSQHAGAVYNRIKSKRILSGLSQLEVANMLKMQQAGYSNLEKGKIALTIERLIQIAAIYEVPPTYFLDGNVQKLIDDLIEKHHDFNALYAQHTFEPELPDIGQISIESYQNILKEKDAQIEALKNENISNRKLIMFYEKENEKAKELLKNIFIKMNIDKNFSSKLKLQIESFL